MMKTWIVAIERRERNIEGPNRFYLTAGKPATSPRRALRFRSFTDADAVASRLRDEWGGRYRIWADLRGSVPDEPILTREIRELGILGPDGVDYEVADKAMSDPGHDPGLLFELLIRMRLFSCDGFRDARYPSRSRRVWSDTAFSRFSRLLEYEDSLLRTTPSGYIAAPRGRASRIHDLVAELVVFNGSKLAREAEVRAQR